MIPDTDHLQIGSLLFEGIDQIDITGPFEVLSRLPNSTYRIYGTTLSPVRDVEGFRLSSGTQGNRRQPRIFLTAGRKGAFYTPGREAYERERTEREFLIIFLANPADHPV